MRVPITYPAICIFFSPFCWLFGWLSGSISWQCGALFPSAWLLVLLGLPHHLFLWFGPGLPSGYQLADGPTRPSYSITQSPIFSGFMVTDLSPVESQRFLVKKLRFVFSQKAEKRICIKIRPWPFALVLPSVKNYFSTILLLKIFVVIPKIF